MNLARRSIDAALVTWLLVIFCLGGGLWGYATIGRLEDPAFTIKTATVITSYPGASAEQVELQVTEPLESAIQQLSELEDVKSTTRPGRSQITVNIQSTYSDGELEQVWDKLKSVVANAGESLPSGAGAPKVNDGFGDVFGLFYAVTAPGFSDAEVHDIASGLRREILAVPGVSGVALAGLPEEEIRILPNMAVLSNLGLPPEALIGQIQGASQVTRSGSVEEGASRLTVDIPEGTDSVDALAELTVSAGERILKLTDIARVERARDETPNLMVRHDGQEAFTLAVAGIADQNIVDIGARVEARFGELAADLPWGVELHPIYEQHKIVDESSTAFLKNLATSVAIVVGVLALFMGWRAGVVVGATLLLTVIGTFFFMTLFGIEMERISLGALIIAMGMLVDNAIVVAEGMQVRMLSGRTSREAADEAAGRVQVPLLGATVIGIMAFAGIGLSPDATGEFMFSLFAVIAISLLLSWLLAVTVTPLLAHCIFRRADEDDAAAYDGRVFRLFGRVLGLAIRFRWLVVALLIAVTVACFSGFAKVEQEFMPPSDTPIFYAHYKLPQGSDIHAVSDDLRRAEDWLIAREDVDRVTTFVGGGATRFMLTYTAEQSQSSYGHMIVRTRSSDQIAGLRAALDDFAGTELLDGEFRTVQLAFGPGNDTPVEVRISGPDAVVLRGLAEQVAAALGTANPPLEDIRTDWREWEPVIVPNYATERAQNAGISRADLAEAILMATDGTTVTQLRERDRQIPVILRTREDGEPPRVSDQIVWSDAASDYVPVIQVIDGMGIEARNTQIQRHDRVRTMSIGAGLPPGVLASDARAQVLAAVEAIDIPHGYSLEWGGEYENSANASENLMKKVPLTLLVMVLISILLFGTLRQPLIIWLLVPMAVNGVVIGLLGTGMPMSFTATLGMLSLSGMLIKNGIVLIEEIDLVRGEGVPFHDAVIQASTSRLRPVVLAAATTILGMAPLLSDPFFASMAVTIMGGLAFATLLTLVAAPVLYAIFFRREWREETETSAEGARA